MLRSSLLASSLLLIACGPAPPRESPDVVILMLDTTRADHLGPFTKNGKCQTPFLDRLAEECLVFDNAWTASTCTAPSIATMFTGLHPTRHGVEVNLLAQVGKKQEGVKVVDFLASVDLVALPRSVSTLTEHLQGAGYQTVGVGSNPNFCEALGFSRGFDHFSEHPHRDATALRDELRGIRAKLDESRPTFTYLHFMDPHAPYESRAPWCEHAGEDDCSPRCRYRSEVSFLDSELERLFEESGWMEQEDLVLILVTDHGEEFLDHGQIMHRFSVYSELSKAALMIRGPGVEAGRTQTPAHHVDLLPTILSMLDLAPPREMDGVSLQEDKAGASEAERPLLTSRRDGTSERRLWALTLGSWRLLQELPDGKAELYNWREDPRERRDLAKQERAKFEEMRDLLETFRTSLRPVPFEQVSVDLTERLNKELSHLGYVSED